MYRFYAVTARECRGKGKSLYLNVKTTVVFTLSWAGVTPAPGDKTPTQTLLTGTKSRIFLNSKVQGLTLPKEA